MFVDQLCDFVEFCDSLPGKTLILGDFNVHFDVPTKVDKFLQVMDIFSLSQSVNAPTHKDGHILDLVLYRQSDDFLISTKVETDLKSDHFAVTCKLNVPKPTPQSTTVTFRPLKSIDKTAFRQDLSDSLSSDCSASVYNSTLRTVLDKHAPVRQRTFRQRKPTPWFSAVSDQFLKLKRERRKAEAAWLKSGKLTVFKQVYETIKRKVIDLVDHAKTTFYSDKLQNSKNCKELFSNFNTIVGKSNSPSLPNTHSPEALPSVFADYCNCL